METFIEYSQRLKKEIKNNPAIIHGIKLCFLDGIDPFQKGTEHEIYTLGKTVSGNYLALRQKKFSMDIKNEIERFEIYCQNAETLANSKAKNLFNHRPESPKFCIGVIYQSKEVGIITEDMSEGGKYEMTNDMADYYSERKLNGEVIDEVFVDLDSCRPDNYFNDSEVISTTPYFSAENVLKV